MLTDDMVRILKENAPTAEEIELVNGYDGSVEMLGDVDRFFKVLSTIPDRRTGSSALPSGRRCART